MMVIICGLPRKTKYEDVKVLLKNECRITEFILDDLVIDESGKGKKVRVGLVEDCDGYEIIRCLNGLRMAGGDSVLRVEAVGKPPTTNQPHQGNYEPKPPPSYLNEYRNSYPNQQSNDLRGRPHAPGFEAPYTGQQSQFSGPAPHGPSADHGTIPTHAPVDSVGRPAPWASNNAPNNQWNQNQSMNLQSSYQQPGNPGYAQQYSSNSQRPFPQGRAQVDQGFRYSENTNKRENAVINLTKGHRKTDARPHVLRNVELVDTQPTNPPLQSFRYPPPSQGFQQQKPITIMKDNFQGPTAYDISANNPPNSYPRQNQSSPQPWAQQGPQIKPRLYIKGNEDPYEKSYEDMRQHGVDSKRANLGKNIQQPMKTDVYKDFEKPGPRFSPNRVIAPGGRQFSPSRRLISPSGGRHSPPIRGLSPSNPLPQGRSFSPPGRNRSPTRRLMSPADRMMSTMDRRPGGPPHDLPQRRQLSPTERIGRGNVPRYSPKRLHPDKPIDKNIELDPLKSSKLLRPTYGVQAPNQPMYSGGFRPNVHENAPFPRSSRQLEQDVPWQQDEDQMYGKMKKRDEDGNSTSRQNAYGDARSPRKSRSPVRRDRSPIKDRYRRHSPSSSSPRRSWALEKYRSPEAREAPPPPNWPGQDSRVDGRFKTGSDRKEDNLKHVSSWERHAFTKDDESNRRDEKLKPYAAGPSKVFRDDFGNKIDTSRGDPFNKQQRDPKFLDRNEFENRGGYRQNARDEPKTKAEYHHVERESIRRQGEFRRKESPRREEGKGNNFTGLDKEFEGIYKRAQEFKKKAEEMSKPERRLTEYSEERGRASRIMEDKERQDERGSLTGRVGDASRHYRDDSSKRRTGDSPRRRMEDSPRHRMEDSPRRRMENSPRRHMETSPRRRMETSSGLRIETSPRRRMEASPRRRMEPSPQRRMEASPLHHMEASPRRRMEDPPRRRTDDSPQSRTDTGDRHPEWKTVDMVRKTYAGLPTYVKTKREKAAEDIAGKIINKKSFVLELSTEARYRVLEELKTTISYKLTELFDAQDVSYIELVIKFQSKYSDKEKDKMFDDVIKSLPGRFKNWKTFGSDSSNVPHKRLKVSTDRTEETRGVLNRTSKRSPDRYITEKSSEVPLKKSKLSPEYKTKDTTQSGVYKRTKRPLYTLKKSRINKAQMLLHAQKTAAKRKILKKNDTATKTIKKGISTGDSNEKERAEKKVEQKTANVEKKVSDPVKLDAMTTKIVESELQDIMIKVWQQLPDNPTDEAEMVVVDKLRNNVGDSLRNMLGLNVTKRLVNVFNLLYVKLCFTSIPKREDVIKLMKKYKMRGLKRIHRTPVIFGAYVDTIEDFDTICSEKSIKCGPVDVSVIPAYKFEKCPKNLITNFDDKDITDDDISDINKIISKIPVNEIKTQEKVEETKEDLVKVKVEKEASKDDLVTVDKEEPTKPKEKLDDKPKEELKLAEQIDEKLKKSSDDIIESCNKISYPKPQRKDSRAMKNIGNKKQAAEECKVEEKKKKDSASSIKNVFIEGNDYDELDDDTILALMSEGIVVDECSGSE